MRFIIFLIICILFSNIVYAELVNYGFDKNWKSHVGEINSLTENLEKEFKFGTLIIKNKKDILTNEEYFFVKKSTKDGFYFIEDRVNENTYNVFLEWKDLENFNNYSEDENVVAHFYFLKNLEKYNISVVNSASKDQYKEILEILKLMPEKLVNNNPKFISIKFGGNIGKNQAKISEYNDDTKSINIFNFLLSSPKRLFTAIIVHEIGHVVDETFLKSNLELRNNIINAKNIINQANATYTFDFGMSSEGRISYQYMNGEFVAENFMHYVLQGDDLREHISLQKNDSVRKAWCEVYNFYKSTVFNGTEFANKNLINTNNIQ